MCKVVNARRILFDVFIGRASSYRAVRHNHSVVRSSTENILRSTEGYFGNLHPIGWCNVCKCNHDRLGCLEAYTNSFAQRVKNDPEFREAIESLRGQTLGCFCSPMACHGHVIQAHLNKTSLLSREQA